jgi:hypothetical protein
MNMYGGVDVQIHIFFTSALVGGEWSVSRPGRFTPEERTPGTHWVGGWVGPRVSLDVEKRKFLNLQGIELRSQSLYRLSYPILLGVLFQLPDSYTQNSDKFRGGSSNWPWPLPSI